jgi:cytochrome c553
MTKSFSKRAALLLTLSVVAAARANDAEVEFFEKQIRPLLVARCEECHGVQEQKGGLRLDYRKGWEKGGDRGPAVTSGKPEASLLITAVGYADKDLQMPPNKPLAASEVALLKEWVRRGAPDPRTGDPPAAVETDDWAATFESRLNWWSLQPLRPSQVPHVQDASWPREPIDRYVRAGLEQAGLAPAATAERDVLLRRLALVLTGLPPTPQQRARFVEEWSRDWELACERLVDELLASPHFGERIARHWMDVVRFSDTYGYESDNRANGSWEYRDYLVRAFNADVGFDQLVKEQLAGDLLPQPRINHEQQLNESAIGPMFFHLGEHREGGSLMFNGAHQQMVDNKIDAFSKAFLALTVACARCHDHKLEAVSQRDYYALAGVFMTPRWTARVIDAPGKNDAAIARLKELRARIRDEMSAQWLAAATKADAWPLEALQQAIPEQEAAAVKPDDMAYPLVRLRKAGSDAGTLWSELAEQWRTTRAQRMTANGAFQTLADFREPRMPAGWVVDGTGMEHGYAEDGTPLVALDGDSVVARLLPRGFHTHALSSKLPGALRMPSQHAVPGSMVSIQLAGGEFAGYQVIQQNGFKSEEIGFLKPAEPAWKSFGDPVLKNGVQRVTVEFATTDLNPNFPPRPGLAAGLPPTDAGYEKRSWLSITGIVGHDQAGSPQDPLDHFATLYQADKPGSAEEFGQRLRQWLTGAVRRWCNRSLQAGDVRIVDWLLAKKLLPNQADAGSRLADLVAEYRRGEQGIAHPRSVTGMDERETHKAGYPLNIRGDADLVGPLVEADFLQMFAGRNGVARSAGSGRLELAEHLVEPEHPLTSRVYVNRVWQWIFGAGLVETPSDFGHLGGRPSNAELLDYVAREFVRDGWSTKTLIRRLVLSQTFRQSGATSAAARERDPDNRLLHHFATRRFEAEAIRDSLLAVSGRLDAAPYGRPIDPPRTLEDTVNKRLFSGPLDGRGRRSIYLTLSIMDPPRFLVGFNLPDLKLPAGRRDVTNVPAQALTLLNDPFVTAMSQYWARELIRQPHAAPDQRIAAMFERAFGRSPNDVERNRWRAAVLEFAVKDPADIMNDEAAWQRLAHALFNAAEFIYVR